MLEIFVQQYFHLLHACAIYSLRIILLVNNIRVRNFRRFGWNENFLTMKISRITVDTAFMSILHIFLTTYLISIKVPHKTMHQLEHPDRTQGWQPSQLYVREKRGSLVNLLSA